MHRRIVRLSLLTAGLAAGAALLPAGAAQAGVQARPKPAQHAAADSTSEQRKVLTYWTEQRMEAARPLEAPAPGKAAKLAMDEPAQGTPWTAQPTGAGDSGAGGAGAGGAGAGGAGARSSGAGGSRAGASGAGGSGARLQAARSSGAAWTGGGTVVKTTGRIFFTTQGRNASCSGSAVTSANKSVVLTAGHCVKLNGTFHTNWVFVPGYANGQRPFGTWPATKLLTTPQWNSGEDINYDVAAAVVAPLDGKSLVDVVGGQGVAFNQQRRQQMYAFGYPAAAPYDGSKLVYCSGRTFDDYLMSEDHGLTCDMTGGSSGGPWMLNFNESTGLGTQNSVNSFKYNFAPNWMFGPYFGNEAQAVYQAAQSTNAA